MAHQNHGLQMLTANRLRDGDVISAHHSSTDHPVCDEFFSFDVVGESLSWDTARHSLLVILRKCPLRLGHSIVNPSTLR